MFFIKTPYAGTLKTLAIALSCLFATCLGAQSVRYSTISFEVYTPDKIGELLSQGIYFDHMHTQRTPNGLLKYTTVVDDKTLAEIQAIGFPVTIVEADMGDYYRRRAAEEAHISAKTLLATAPTGFEFGSLRNCYTYTEIERELDSLRMIYPNLVSEKSVIGYSYEGRPIWAVKISDNPNIDEAEPEVLYDALHHAREPGSMMTVMYFMHYLTANYGTDDFVTYLINNRELYFIPIVNPDGYVYNEINIGLNQPGLWRKNRAIQPTGHTGVDLNRNYGYQWAYDNEGSSPDPSSQIYRGSSPFSETETTAYRNFCLSRSIRANFSYHSYGSALLTPWGYADQFPANDEAFVHNYATRLTSDNHYKFGTIYRMLGYVANGTTYDWMFGPSDNKPQAISFTPEVGLSEFWPTATELVSIMEDNVPANLKLAQIAGPAISVEDHLIVDSLGNNNGFADLEEVSEIKLLMVNYGLEPALITNIELSFDTGAIEVLSAGLVPMDSIAAGDSAWVSGITIRPRPGSPVSPMTTVNYIVEDHLLAETLPLLFIGTPVVILADSAELDSSLWTSNNGWDTTSTTYSSPEKCYTDSPNRQYSLGQENWMRLRQALDLSDAQAAVLKFDARWDIKDAYDYGAVELSNYGITWEKAAGKYTFTQGNGTATGFRHHIYSGNQEKWVTETTDLTPFLDDRPIYLRFMLGTSTFTTTTRDGWYVDNIIIYKYLQPTVAITMPEDQIKGEFTLHPNYPNPFNPSTTIKLDLPVAAKVTLEIYNIAGQRIVRGYNNVSLNAGNHSYVWDGTDAANTPVTSGVYFYSLRVNNTTKVGKMLLVR